MLKGYDFRLKNHFYLAFIRAKLAYHRINFAYLSNMHSIMNVYYCLCNVIGSDLLLLVTVGIP